MHQSDLHHSEKKQGFSTRREADDHALSTPRRPSPSATRLSAQQQRPGGTPNLGQTEISDQRQGREKRTEPAQPFVSPQPKTQRL
jgi:hypothetical protein